MIRVADLQGIHDKVYLGDRRRPNYKVLMFDQTDTFGEIVLGIHTQVPIDITDCVENITISEQEESATTARLTVVPDYTAADPLTPYHFMGRKIIQIFYQDSSIDEDWISLFIGPAIGQPGYRRNRESNEKIIDVSCVDRSFFYNKRRLNSPDFVQGTDLGDMAVTIATNAVYGMGLTRQEIKFGLLRHIVYHSKAALFDVTYMEGLQYIGFIVDKEPAWDNNGYLVLLDTSLDKPPVRKYEDEGLFINVEWPSGNVDINNAVEIIGLSSKMEKVISPVQELATVRGTVGYFESQFKTRVYFSEDRQARAQNVQVYSFTMNGQLGRIINSTPKLEDIDEFSCVLVIDTPYQSWIFVAFFSTYIAFFAVASLFGGLVSDVMLLSAAAWLTVGLMIMQQMGTFEVTIAGEPYKLVYKEIRGEAQWGSLEDYEARIKTIENHMVHSQALADEIAYRELKKEVVKMAQRSLTLPLDPFLQKTDIIELPDGSLYYIKSISRTFKRSESSDMQIEALMVRSGKEYSEVSGYSEY